MRKGSVFGRYQSQTRNQLSAHCGTINSAPAIWPMPLPDRNFYGVKSLASKGVSEIYMLSKFVQSI